MRLAAQKERRSPWPHCSRRHPWTPCRAAPLDPSALEIHWRNGWLARSGASVMEATSRRSLANRSRNVMDVRVLIWDRLSNRMTLWRRYCTYIFSTYWNVNSFHTTLRENVHYYCAIWPQNHYGDHSLCSTIFLLCFCSAVLTQSYQNFFLHLFGHFVVLHVCF